MEKAVHIVTIPLSNSVIPRNSIVKCISEFSSVIMVGNTFITDCYIDKQQDWEYKCLQELQLLVLSDDLIHKGDLCMLLDHFGNVFSDAPKEYNPSLGHVLNKGLRKVIASYPQIEGTLPISKETVRRWIGEGCPKEAGVEYAKEEYQVKTIEGDWLRETSIRLVVKPDNQGNLPLEFTQPFKSTMPTYTVPQIPTNEQILGMAQQFINRTEMCDEYPDRLSQQTADDYQYYYMAGYKQALKDLKLK